jgi:DNA polymerase-3 subunit epsilon
MDFGLIVDLETTGLDPIEGRIIEIGLLEFAVEGEGEPVVTRMYGALQDPGIEISAEVTRITGIAPAHVVGQAIDWDIVATFFERASIVVAHNADFDRGFLEAHWQRTGTKLARKPHWACSMRHIDWKKHHFNTLALNYLAADNGFVNPFAHRAVFDCATTFRLIAPHLQELTARSYEREVVVRALNSPFETKDVLRARGYRWDPAERCWGKVIGEAALVEERQFLASEVYRGEPRHAETILER